MFQRADFPRVSTQARMKVDERFKVEVRLQWTKRQQLMRLEPSTRALATPNESLRRIPDFEFVNRLYCMAYIASIFHQYEIKAVAGR